MALICPSCHTVHPNGIGTCEIAKETRLRDAEVMKMRVIAHQENCDCPTPTEHIRKRDQERHQERQRRQTIFGFDKYPIGFKV